MSQFFNVIFIYEHFSEGFYDIEISMHLKQQCHDYSQHTLPFSTIKMLISILIILLHSCIADVGIYILYR